MINIADAFSDLLQLLEKVGDTVKYKGEQVEVMKVPTHSFVNIK